MPKPDKHRQHLLRRISWEDLDPEPLRQLIALARDEDLAGWGLRERPPQPGDATSALMPEDKQGAARLMAREPMTVCGLPLVPMVLECYGGKVEFDQKSLNGDNVCSGDCLGTLRGDVSTLLQAERVLLNFLQRLSGIATATARLVTLLGESGPRLLDTRKTTPGYRMLEKWAVATGGGWNHRLGLFDRIMLKDNHLAATGSVGGERLAAAARAARASRPDLAVEVEVDALEQIPPVLEAGVDVIMLDNFSLDEAKTALKLIGDKCWVELSGGITEETLPELVKLGADFISTGAVVHRSRWVDIGLDWCDE